MFWGCFVRIFIELCEDMTIFVAVLIFACDVATTSRLVSPLTIIFSYQLTRNFTYKRVSLDIFRLCQQLGCGFR